MARKSRFTPDQRAALRKARQKKQERYWENRSQSRVLVTDRQGDKAQAEQKRAYEDAKKSVRQEIEKFYEKFSDETGIDSQSARKNLSNRELDDFKKELARKRKVIKEMLAKDPNNDKLRAYDSEFERLSKVRALTRREALEANIEAEIVKLGGTQDQQINARSNNVINTALWMNSADLSMLGDVNAKLGVGHPKQVRRAAEENWQHGDFSDKIWSDKEKLIDETRNVLTRAFVHHDGVIDTARRLSSKMNASESNALRLVRTEFNHLSNQAALAEYQAKGIKKYKFVAAIDSRTSDICRELDGQVFNVADAKTGLNFPPMHPNCRSVTTPVIDWDDEDEWDYSGIELDDDELKQLGLTDEDVAEIDSKDARSERLTDAPAPSLTVQQANQATEDTQSVQRRAEQAEAVKQQGEAIEIKARNLYDRDIGNIFDDIDRNEKLNQKLYVDTPITLPQAAIEAENLDRVHIDIQKADLEALKLQARAAKLDESIPKPDPKRTAALEDEIDQRINASKRRKEADLPDDEVIKQAMPKLFDTPEATPEAAIEPRTAFGKWWQKVRDGVELAKERFNAWLERQRREMALIEALPALSNVLMVLGPINSSPYLTPRAKKLLESWQHPGGRMPGQSLESLKQWESEYEHQNKAILKKAKQAGVATLYTTPKYQRMNAYERMKENGEMLKREFSEAESDEIAKLNAQLSAQIKASRMPTKITVARGLKSDTIVGKFKDGTYPEPGFTSTSLSEAQARNFAGKDAGAVVVYIDIPQNAPALYLEKMTDVHKQYEILLDRGSKFRYLRRGKMPDGTIFYHLELIVDD